jgi:hypothetical protein
LGDIIPARQTLAKLVAINPIIGEHSFHENTGLSEGDRFNEQQRIIIMLNLSLPPDQITNTGIVGDRETK